MHQAALLKGVVASKEQLISATALIVQLLLL